MKITIAIGLALALLAGPLQAAQSVWDKGAPVLDKPVEMTVYRSPTCGCCGKWVDHMKKNGFAVRDIVTEDMDKLKGERGVPKELQSCHTALVGGYVVEGHVPAADVADLLKKKPQTVGLTAPGMPMGSPGMDMGGAKAPFDVLEFDKSGKTQVFHGHPSY
jgi:hypothetical protein